MKTAGFGIKVNNLDKDEESDEEGGYKMTELKQRVLKQLNSNQTALKRSIMKQTSHRQLIVLPHHNQSRILHQYRSLDRPPMPNQLDQYASLTSQHPSMTSLFESNAGGVSTKDEAQFYMRSPIRAGNQQYYHLSFVERVKPDPTVQGSIK